MFCLTVQINYPHTHTPVFFTKWVVITTGTQMRILMTGWVNIFRKLLHNWEMELSVLTKDRAVSDLKIIRKRWIRSKKTDFFRGASGAPKYPQIPILITDDMVKIAAKRLFFFRQIYYPTWKVKKTLTHTTLCNIRIEIINYLPPPKYINLRGTISFKHNQQ